MSTVDLGALIDGGNTPMAHTPNEHTSQETPIETPKEVIEEPVSEEEASLPEPEETSDNEEESSSDKVEEEKSDGEEDKKPVKKKSKPRNKKLVETGKKNTDSIEELKKKLEQQNELVQQLTDLVEANSNLTEDQQLQRTKATETRKIEKEYTDYLSKLTTYEDAHPEIKEKLVDNKNSPLYAFSNDQKYQVIHQNLNIEGLFDILLNHPKAAFEAARCSDPTETARRLKIMIQENNFTKVDSAKTSEKKERLGSTAIKGGNAPNSPRLLTAQERADRLRDNRLKGVTHKPK